MKVAFGFFGQPRFYSSKHSGVTKKLIDQYNADVYCHTWWSPEESQILGARNNKYPAQQDVANGLQKLYSPVKLLVEKPLLEVNEHGYTDDVFTQYDKNYLWCKRFPSSGEYMSAFVSQKRVYSMIDWDKYDFVLRWRYDFETSVFPDLNKLDPNKMHVIINAATWFDKELYDDCALITPPRFKELWNIYDYIDDYRPQLTTLDPEHPHMMHARALGLYDDIEKHHQDEYYGRLVRHNYD